MKERLSTQPTPQTDIAVTLDDRVRLLSALLAATRYPDDEQQRFPHGTHPHARHTRSLMLAHERHPAVIGLQSILDRGVPLEALFTVALTLGWPDLTVSATPDWLPPSWVITLRDFFRVSELAGWWEADAHAWDKALDDVRLVLGDFALKPLFESFLGQIEETFTFIPNISYPTDLELALRLGQRLFLIVPPRLAWGTNPPWPYAEDPAHLLRAAINGYGRLLLQSYLSRHADAVNEAARTPLPVSEAFARLHPTWADQFTALFIAGATAIYLEGRVSKAEADAYVLMERKTRHMEILPSVIHVLRRFLTETAGDKFKTLVDYLPVFARQVRVAQRLVGS
jgi:hypothetical protein